MNALVVYCHPVEGSFCSAMRDAAISGLRAAGHSVDVIDLAVESFNPVMSRSEWDTYRQGNGDIPVGLERDVSLVKSAEIIVFIYPTWWGGLPAQLKGWLERVMLPGIAFVFNENNKVRPGRLHIRLAMVIRAFCKRQWSPDTGTRTSAEYFLAHKSVHIKFVCNGYSN